MSPHAALCGLFALRLLILVLSLRQEFAASLTMMSFRIIANDPHPYRYGQVEGRAVPTVNVFC